jgi:hypothetical protein
MIHRPEFKKLEHLPVLTHAPLRENYRATGTQEDAENRQEQEWGKQCNEQRTHQSVEGPLGERAVVVRIRYGSGNQRQSGL